MEEKNEEILDRNFVNQTFREFYAVFWGKKCDKLNVQISRKNLLFNPWKNTIQDWMTGKITKSKSSVKLENPSITYQQLNMAFQYGADQEKKKQLLLNNV